MSVDLFHPYVTLEEVQDFLEDHSPLNVDRIKSAINRASRYVDQETEARFYKTTIVGAIADKDANSRNAFKIHSGVLNLQPSYIESPFKPIISVDIMQAGIGMQEGIDYKVDYGEGIISSTQGEWSTTPGDVIISATLGYNSDDDATPSPDIPGMISDHARELAAIRSGLWKKVVATDGQGGTKWWNPWDVPQRLIDDLRNWKVRQ